MPSRVEAGLKYTFKPTRDEFFTIDVHIADDTKPGETTPEAFERVYGLVQSKFVEKRNEAEEFFN